MNDPLDRLVDEAAARVVRHEPSEALNGAVMDRVSASAGPRTRGGLALGGVGAAVAMAVLAVAFSLNRTPPPGIDTPARAASAPAAPPPTPARAPDVTRGIPERQRSALAVRRVTTVSFAVDPSEPIDVVAPIAVEPLAAPEILVSDQIQIEPLTIEPLSASND